MAVNSLFVTLTIGIMIMQNKYKLEDFGAFLCATDTEALVCVRWQRHQFNDTQKVTILDESCYNVMDAAICATSLANCLREMADWLRENHYETIF